MALINYATREINAKIVYYGPGLSGKTTNIHYVFEKVKPGNKGKLISLATQGDRTLFFDFLPVELGNIKGFRTRFHLYTVPGQVFYNSTRKMVLKGSDGVVFVADSQKMMMDENIQSLENLKTNLRDMGLSFETFPVVMQYNKRDLPNAVPIEDMNQILNPGALPYFEASAIAGDGVLKTLTGIVKFVLHDLKEAPDTHSLDFEAIEQAADSMAESAAQPAPEAPVSEVPAAAPEVSLSERMAFPSISPPQPKLSPRAAGVHSRTVPAGNLAGASRPQAAPEPTAGAPVEAEDLFEAVEVLEDLGDMMGEAEKITPHEVTGSPYDLDELHGLRKNELDAFSDIVSCDTHPAPDASSLDKLLADYHSSVAPLPQKAPAKDVSAEIPSDFHLGIDIGPATGTGIQPLSGFGAGGFSSEPAAGAAPAPPEPAAPAAGTPPKPSGICIKRTFTLPVRISTRDGVKPLSLKLNLELELDGENIGDVSSVEVQRPALSEAPAVNPVRPEKDQSKHPPPTAPVKRPSVDNTEPIIRAKKKGMFERMFGR